MLSRTLLLAGFIAVGLLGTAVPSLASGWGSVDCSQTPGPVCDLGAGHGGDHPPGAQGETPGHGDQNGSSTNGSQNNGDSIIGDDGNAATCSYVRSDYRPPTDGIATIAYRPPPSGGSITVQPAVFIRSAAPSPIRAQPVQNPPPGQPGAWYVYQCSRPGFRDALSHPPVWIPDGQPGAGPSPAELAQLARNQLHLLFPRIETNPAGDQLVNLPTWLWLDRASWRDVSATASVPGVSVTAVARPTSVSWSLGDGSSVTCSGPGTPFSSGADPKSSSPDCGYTYHRSSASQANQAFPVTATVHWTITWSGAGQGGTFPDMTTTTAARFRVAESQALGTG